MFRKLADRFLQWMLRDKLSRLPETQVIKDLLNEQLSRLNPLYNTNFIYSEIEQRLLVSNWLLLRKNGIILSDPFQYAFKNFSQTNEDGILLYIFTMIGAANKKVVEIGVNCDGSHINIPESISVNLIVYHGWTGLLCDANEENVGQVLHFFHLANQTRFFFNKQNSPVNEGSAFFGTKTKVCYVTPENINQLLIDHSCDGEIDLMSVDVDSYDYHIWDSLEVCRPRVIIMETDGGKISYDTAVTVKEDAGLEQIYKFMQAGYSGTMSLAAAVKLAKLKGYRLVALAAGGWNAFFIRNDICPALFPELAIEEAYKLLPSVYKLKERGETATFDQLEAEYPGLFVKV
jgi:hypothetical protein